MLSDACPRALRARRWSCLRCFRVAPKARSNVQVSVAPRGQQRSQKLSICTILLHTSWTPPLMVGQNNDDLSENQRPLEERPAGPNEMTMVTSGEPHLPKV